MGLLIFFHYIDSETPPFLKGGGEGFGGLKILPRPPLKRRGS